MVQELFLFETHSKNWLSMTSILVHSECLLMGLPTGTDNGNEIINDSLLHPCDVNTKGLPISMTKEYAATVWASW